jgi:outer membrane protein assembly factor BamA
MIRKNSKTIRVRIIGGPGKDSVIEVAPNNATDIYDDDKNFFQIKHASLHLRHDSAVHSYDYAGYHYNKHGLSPTFFYDYDDRLYVGLGYGFANYAWRRKPFASKQSIDLGYSLAQKALRTSYTALFPKVIGDWDATFSGNYDAMKWRNFFGLGNATVRTTSDISYFRVRTREWFVEAGIDKDFGKSSVSISPFFRSVKIFNDTANYFAKVFLPLNRDSIQTSNYTGVQLTYTFVKLDDSLVPQKGITIKAGALYTLHLSKREFFQSYFGKAEAYIPLCDRVSLAIRAGAGTILAKASIISSAEFYEHTVIGGPLNLRGFNRERFWGKTSFYNNNELRYLTDIKTHLVNGKAGLFAFLDQGRVWQPGEDSGSMHLGYGAGIILAPFHKICAVVTYGISKETRLWQLSNNKLF